jgi:hypothetical protein
LTASPRPAVLFCSRCSLLPYSVLISELYLSHQRSVFLAKLLNSKKRRFGWSRSIPVGHETARFKDQFQPGAPNRTRHEPHKIGVEQFLEMLRFEQRSKLDEDTHDWFARIAEEQKWPIAPMKSDFILATALRLTRALAF